MAAVVFFLCAIVTLAGAIGVVVLRNPFYSVLSLVMHLLSLAGLFLLLRAEFVAAAQVVVYAGAVMVLYVFVVAYIGDPNELMQNDIVPRRWPKVGALILAASLAVVFMTAILGSGLTAIDGKGAPYIPGFGTPAQIGELLLTKFLFPFEVASLLLLAGAVGAVVLVRERDKSADDGKPQLFPRPEGTGTMTEAVLSLEEAQNQFHPAAEKSTHGN